MPPSHRGDTGVPSVMPRLVPPPYGIATVDRRRGAVAAIPTSSEEPDGVRMTMPATAASLPDDLSTGVEPLAAMDLSDVKAFCRAGPPTGTRPQE